jgi:hypothetical protein
MRALERTQWIAHSGLNTCLAELPELNQVRLRYRTANPRWAEHSSTPAISKVASSVRVARALNSGLGGVRDKSDADV